MKTLVKYFSFLPILVLCMLTGCASAPNSEEDWPKNTSDLLKKSQVIYSIGRNSQLTVDFKKNTYTIYTPTFLPCNAGGISSITQMSDTILEVKAFPDKEKSCYGKLLTINLKNRSSILVEYGLSGNTADIKSSYDGINPRFIN